MKSTLVAASLLALALVANVSFVGASPEGGGWIGIELDEGKHGGALVKHVLENTPGERAGLHDGDEVLTVDGIKASPPKRLVETVKAAGIGHVAKLRVLDEHGATRTVALTLEPKPSMESLQRGSLLGKRAPDFEPVVEAGAKLPKISALRGQVVLIDFFATWCGPCVESMPHVEELHQRLAARGLTVLGVSAESPSIVASAQARFHVTYPLAYDNNEGVSSRYHVFALPTMIVIDRQGVVREVSVADTDAVDAAVAAALKSR